MSVQKTLLTASFFVLGSLVYQTALTMYFDSPPASPAPPAPPIAYVTPELPGLTIVTAYYSVPSKHSNEEYSGWIKNFMSLQDPVVVFTSPDLAPWIAGLRSHASNSTIVISEALIESPVYKSYPPSFWAEQHRMDPEASNHQSYWPYIIWLSKTDWLSRGASMNPFSTGNFAWLDIGYLRHSSYNNDRLFRMIPEASKRQVVLLDVDSLISHVDPSDASYGKSFVGGGYISGSPTAISRYRSAYLKELQLSAELGEFIGKDQIQMRAACDNIAGLCRLIQPINDAERYGDPWFFMAPYVHGDVLGGY